ncbi:MAG TPA: zf-TFIIB domain-containing protein [Bryobacteraceae bacterium]|nr:zf-TFIIB domain-containing protein [Bryobacteraceae bacterium]
MNCPNCGATMRLEEDKEFFHCDFCNNVFFPEKNDDGVRVLGEPAALNCPVCAIPLVHAAMEGWRILYCNRCRGMLISMDIFIELTHVLHDRSGVTGAVPRPPDPKDLQRRTNCPQCHHQMDTHYYAGPGNVIIDDCSNCHLNWLDYGELRRIVRSPDREYDKPTGFGKDL